MINDPGESVMLEGPRAGTKFRQVEAELTEAFILSINEDGQQ